MPADALRVAVVGIDGSGKSTVIRLLTGGATVSCLRAHENPDGPLHALSRHLGAMSRDADRLGAPDLKLAVLYLQMCTYAVTERFFIREMGAQVVISERHPIVDALVYIPIYRSAIERATGPDRPAELRRGLASLDTANVEAALAWCERLGRRLGDTPDLTTVAADLVRLADLPAEEQAAALAVRFDVSLPDVVVFLDIDVAEARRRIHERDRPPEMHERQDRLRQIREGYDTALKSLEKPRVHRILADTASPAELAAEIDRLITE
ncbi:deoxynucleoside kinase [Actinomadura rubrisoli]|uniref:deoxynucleoside kinase n=1 Tax=Actinomadura rubrisoli TaxID=2530368 RepID=UPI0014051535|nr:deoxynucleoside kinase [Actinomadura rubrisoli]